MLRYILKIPRSPAERPDMPRRVVEVFMHTDAPDAFEMIQFAGTFRDISLVREHLFHRTYGARGAFLDDETTARNVAVAMESPAMQGYEPECVEGETLFAVTP